MTAAPAPTRRTFALFVLGWMSFIAYGSFVPLDYRPRPFADAKAAFSWAMRERLQATSRSDAAANVMLGIPLGFGLLGLLCVDRVRSRAQAAALGLLLLPGCVGFAAAVEFGQVYFPTRTPAGSDVVCQGLGAVLGITAWVLYGPRLTEHARTVWGGSGLGGATGRLLVGYLLLLAFVQALPLDLTPSPKDLYKKLRDKVVFVPFAEFLGMGNEAGWDRFARLVEVFGLYVPIGLLAARLPGRFWRMENFPRLLGLALATAACLEGLQLWVASRTPSGSDVLVGTAGATTGWLLAWMLHEELGPSDVVGLGSWWLLVLAVISWQPFPPRIHPPIPFDWVPGMPFEGGNPLFALEAMLTKLVLFGLGGVIIAGADPVCGRRRLIIAAAVGLVISGVLEAGQTVVGAHTPCVTDVLLGGLGGFGGAWISGRVRADSVPDNGTRPTVY